MMNLFFCLLALCAFSHHVLACLSFNPSAAGDGETLHDPASQERQRVRGSATKHDSANGETGSRRLHQHCEQGESPPVVAAGRWESSARSAFCRKSAGDGGASQSWSQVIRQTEALGRVMRSHADDLNSGPLHRLATLIRDKQQLKKSYQSLHQQLESHNHKVGSVQAGMVKHNKVISEDFHPSLTSCWCFIVR